MNIAEVEALAASLARAAEETTSISARIEKIVTSSAWVGADATRFRQQRWPGHRDQLRAVSTGLAEFAKTARSNALEQRRASDATTAAAAGAAAMVVGGARAVTVDGLDGKWKWERSKGPLFRAGKGDRDAIDSNDVVQGELGDCYMLANLKALAQRDPDLIRRMVVDNGDGTYTVTFHENGQESPITVTNEFLTKVLPWELDNRTPFAKSGDGELWVRIVEKAYAEKFRGGYGGISDGKLPVALEHLTGLTSESSSPATLSDNDLDSLGSNLGHGTSIATTGSTKFVDADLQELFRSKKIVSGHAYAIERIDTENNLIYLDNPWGRLDLVLTYDEYRRAFNQLHEATISEQFDMANGGSYA